MKKISFITISLFFLFCHFSSYSKSIAPGEEHQIDVHSICHRVQNNGLLTYYIPIGEKEDWVLFYENPPTGVSFLTCIYYNWEASTWSTCSSPCDGGTQSRTVTCRGTDGQTYADEKCTQPKPSTARDCNTGIVSDCSGSGNFCSGSNFPSGNACNTPVCTGTKPITNPSYSSWSAWSNWVDPGLGSCNSNCKRQFSRSRTRVCQAGNSCGSNSCSSPTLTVGQSDTETEYMEVSCNPGQGSCPDNTCDNGTTGKWCPGKSWGISPTATPICTNCFSDSCYKSCSGGGCSGSSCYGVCN